MESKATKGPGSRMRLQQEAAEQHLVTSDSSQAQTEATIACDELGGLTRVLAAGIQAHFWPKMPQPQVFPCSLQP